MSRIRSVEAFPLAYPEPHYRGIERYITLARVETDDGHVGWGECISQFREATLATRLIIEEGYAPMLVGEEATDLGRLWRKLMDHIWWYGPEGIAAFGVSAVDMAMWDLKGQLLGLPVSKLIGGQLRDRVVAMGSFVFDMEDFDWTLNEFRWLCEQGYRFVKAGWGMRPEAVFGQDRDRDLKLVGLIRETIGPERELVVDTPGARGIWDVPTAIQRFRDLEPHRLRWIEQPLRPRDLAGHARLRAAVTTAVGTGEDEWSLESYRHLIRSAGVDVVQIDPGRCHGISGCCEIIRMIEGESLEFSMHTWSSALSTAASIHLMAISEAGVSMDLKPHESPMQHELVDDPWEQEGGYLAVRERPGLGVTVREEAVKKYLMR